MLLLSTCAKAKHSGASKVKVSPCVPSISHSLAALALTPSPQATLHLTSTGHTLLYVVAWSPCPLLAVLTLSGPSPVHPKPCTAAEGPLSYQPDTRWAPTGIRAASLSLMHNEPIRGTFMDLHLPAQCSHKHSLHPRTCLIHHVRHHMHVQCGTTPVHCT